uniref:Uncharacterized protein n=1 Tax=Romanomermis culicivorax TaxID=13658 RepID=A0A915JUH9_ROMCU
MMVQQDIHVLCSLLVASKLKRKMYLEQMMRTMQEKVLRQTELGMYLNMSQVDQCRQNKENFCCNMYGRH